MPVRQKIATPRAAAGGGAKASTRSAVNNIRHATDELLDTFLTERRNQARTYSRELRKGGIARRKAVRTMMEGFRQAREESSRDTAAELCGYMRALQQSVLEARQDVDAQLRQIAGQRKRFAVVQARFLSRAHQRQSRSGAELMSGLADARENATRDVQVDLKRFAATLRSDVGIFRQNLREELGTNQTQPGKSFAGKSSAPTARKAISKAKPAKGARPAATMKVKAAPTAKAPAKSAKPKLRAAKTAG